jgi:tetratricopeptide (TPR) repeat protein
MTAASASSYEDRINRALADNQLGEVERLARQAFADTSADEGNLAWIAAVAEEKGIPSAPEFLESFVKLFPASLHLPRIYLADNLARAGRFDEATDHARRYLRLAKDAGVFENLGNTRILRHGVSHAFLLLTAAYTELGARSYSEGVLKHALHFDLDPDFVKKIQQELARLAVEMRDPSNRATNEKWNAFFARGSGADGLYEACTSRGFPVLAKRVDLLDGHFRFNSKFEVGEAELYLLVNVTNENANILM